jgi:hypothetical protein
MYLKPTAGCQISILIFEEILWWGVSIKMKLYPLGLLALSSFNALGTECIIKASDTSIYTAKLSIYSYSNDINTKLWLCFIKSPSW